MTEAVLVPGLVVLLIAIGGLLFWAGVMFSRVDSLREWRDQQQRTAEQLMTATAKLAEGHVDVIKGLQYMRGQLDMILARTNGNERHPS